MDATAIAAKEFAVNARSVRFWRWAFLSAGIIGLVELAPLYLAEDVLTQSVPPALTHPEFYYGFIGVALTWQLVFIVMARDPARYRALVPAAILEKLLYVISTCALFAVGRVHGFASLLGATIDFGWLVLFAVASARTRHVDDEISRAYARAYAWHPGSGFGGSRRYGSW